MEAEWSVLRCHSVEDRLALHGLSSPEFWSCREFGSSGITIVMRSLAFDLLYVLARQRGKYRSGRIWEPIALSPSSRVIMFIPSSSSFLILGSHPRFSSSILTPQA